MRRFLFMGLILCGLMTACQSSGGGKRVEEIRDDSGVSNADLVRNPVSADQPLDTVNVAKIVFEEKEYNFQEAYEGDIVIHVFTFKNTGKIPLIISDARSTCGCTVPNWPREPIAPGGEGQIEVRFNTSHKKGRQNKKVTVTANTYPGDTELFVYGLVKPSANDDAQ